MDTSISKALIMIAGVLLAMLVIAFITFSFIQIGDWAKTQDDEILTEQAQKFNKEYEVYDKDLMYGVDVISCLNKALSNNKKIRDRRVVNGETYDDSYEVKVKVSLKSGKDLSESMAVYHMDERNNKEVKYDNDGDGPDIQAGETEKPKIGEDAKFQFVRTNYANYSSFKDGAILVTKNNEKFEKTEGITEFNLTKDENATGEEALRALLSVSNTISEIVKNTNTNASNPKSWTKAEFRSALYDLKTRKFKCEKFTYSNAGRVDYIEFKEL